MPMTKADWKAIGIAGSLFGLAVTIHGVTSKRWRDLHTVALILGIAAMLGPELRQK
jgi:hypothetical protein